MPGKGSFSSVFTEQEPTYQGVDKADRGASRVQAIGGVTATPVRTLSGLEGRCVLHRHPLQQVPAMRGGRVLAGSSRSTQPYAFRVLQKELTNALK